MTPETIGPPGWLGTVAICIMLIGGVCFAFAFFEECWRLRRMRKWAAEFEAFHQAQSDRLRARVAKKVSDDAFVRRVLDSIEKNSNGRL